MAAIDSLASWPTMWNKQRLLALKPGRRFFEPDSAKRGGRTGFGLIWLGPLHGFVYNIICPVAYSSSSSSSSSPPPPPPFFSHA